MTKTAVTITVDTEASIGGTLTYPDQRTPVFEGPVDGMVNGRSQALGFMLETLRAFNMRATFFVETLHTRYFGYDPMRSRCAQLLEADQDIQLHIHPCWRSFEDGALKKIDKNDESCGRPYEELVDIFEDSQMRFEQLVGSRAIAARTGKFSAERETFGALREVGIKITSCINTALRQTADESLRLAGGRRNVDGVLEFPVTCFSSWSPKARKSLRGMKIAGCSFQEMRQVLDQAQQNSVEHVIIITHPFEFIKTKDIPYAQIKTNRLVQGRLRQLCKYLSENPERFDVVPISDFAHGLDDLEDRSPVQLSASLPWTAKRMVENVAYDSVWAL